MEKGNHCTSGDSSTTASVVVTVVMNLPKVRASTTRLLGTTRGESIFFLSHWHHAVETQSFPPWTLSIGFAQSVIETWLVWTYYHIIHCSHTAYCLIFFMDSPPSVIKTSFWSTETSSSSISQIIEFDVTARTDLGGSRMWSWSEKPFEIIPVPFLQHMSLNLWLSVQFVEAFLKYQYCLFFLKYQVMEFVVTLGWSPVHLTWRDPWREINSYKHAKQQFSCKTFKWVPKVTK